MNSPAAPHSVMTREPLEDGLIGYHCLESGGIFIMADSYWRWLQRRPSRLPHLPRAWADEPSRYDSTSAKICPETGGLMQRYQVGHGFDFFIERSPTGSIWLDAGEWEALKKRQFHDELHLIFTAPWQENIKHEEIAQNEMTRMSERLGQDLVAQLSALKEALEDHPDRALALSFLNQE